MHRNIPGHLLILVFGILLAQKQLTKAQDLCTLSRALEELSCGNPSTDDHYYSNDQDIPSTAPVTAPVIAPVIAPVTAPVTAPIAVPTTCEGPYPGFAECEERIEWIMANWNAVEWSQEYINGGVDGSRCSVQRYLNLYDAGGPWCPWNNHGPQPAKSVKTSSLDPFFLASPEKGGNKSVSNTRPESKHKLLH